MSHSACGGCDIPASFILLHLVALFHILLCFVVRPNVVAFCRCICPAGGGVKRTRKKKRFQGLDLLTDGDCVCVSLQDLSLALLPTSMDSKLPLRPVYDRQKKTFSPDSVLITFPNF